MKNNEQQNLLQEAITDLYNHFDSPEEAKEFLRKIFIAAIGSPLADSWTALERVDVFDFFELTENVVKAAHPMYKKEKVETGG